MNPKLESARQWPAKTGVFILLVAMCGLVRLIPHPPNFTPVAAATLFAGFFFTRQLVALCVPLAALLISDLAIGFYAAPVMIFVYAAHLAPVALGSILAKRLTVLRVGGCAAIAALVFFLASNFAVWMTGGMYPLTPGGLWGCYAAALPFYQYTLYGNLFFAALIFGTYAAAIRLAAWSEERQLVPVRAKR